MARKKQDQDVRLTDVELELMTLLWRLGEGTVHDVIAALPEGRTLAYTSVSTMMRILEQKGIVASRKEGRGHVYAPLISREVYEASSVRLLVRNVFEGTPASLVRRLLENEEVTPDELEAIRALLDARRQS